MAINANGSSSKPGDWNGGGAAGGGSYQEPGQRSSYDSKGNQLTNAAGMNPNAGGKNNNLNSGGLATAITKKKTPARKIVPVSAPAYAMKKKGFIASLLNRWRPTDMERVNIKGIYGQGTPSPKPPEKLPPNQLPGNDAAYDPTTGRYNDYYNGSGPGYRTSSPTKTSQVKDQSRVPSGGF